MVTPSADDLPFHETYRLSAASSLDLEPSSASPSYSPSSSSSSPQGRETVIIVVGIFLFAVTARLLLTSARSSGDFFSLSFWCLVVFVRAAYPCRLQREIFSRFGLSIQTCSFVCRRGATLKDRASTFVHTYIVRRDHGCLPSHPPCWLIVTASRISRGSTISLAGPSVFSRASQEPSPPQRSLWFVSSVRYPARSCSLQL